MRVNLLFGFLGSGKTTLVRHLLAQRPREKTAIIVNEFGEVGVDGDILRGRDIDMIELNSGCLCCTLKGSLMQAVEELAAKAGVERIIVEATGVAQPGELTETLADASMKAELEIGPLVTVVDAAKFPKLASMLGEFYTAQIENADILVLNKTDLVSAAALEEVRREVREINPDADIVFAERADVDVDYLLARRPGGIVLRAAGGAAPGNGAGGAGAGHDQDHAAHDDRHDHDHPAHDPHAGAPAESFVLPSPRQPRRAAVERFFRGLPDAVWRAKGFLRLDGEACLIQYALGQLEITPAPPRTHEHVVFIGRAMDREALASRFAATGDAPNAATADDGAG
jgi:G3E family GTPase